MTVNYTVNKTDGTLFSIVPQGTVVNQAGLTLIGKNYIAFGETLNENMVRLAENFAAASSPSSPLTGQLWYDKANAALKLYSGSQYRNLITGTFQASAPTSPYTNQLWYDTTNSKLYVYNDGSFKLVGPAGSNTTKVIDDVIVDTVGNNHRVLRFLVNNKNFAIATDETFTPAASQPGFKDTAKDLAPGINLGTDDFWEFKLRGTATRAESLQDGLTFLPAANIVRNNSNGNITGTLNASAGLSAGGSSALQFYPDADDLKINNTISSGDIYIQTSTITGLQPTLVLTSSQQIGIGTATPSETLHVVGTMRVDYRADFFDEAYAVTPLVTDYSTRIATTEYVKDQLVDTILTKSLTGLGPTAPDNTSLPNYTALSLTDYDKLATVGWTKNQFVNTILTGVPQAPDISLLTQSDQQIANTKFVQDVITATLVTKAEASDLSSLTARVTAVENNRSLKAGETYTGTHNFTGATLTVATPSASSHAASKSYVDTNYASIVSPAFTGEPTAPVLSLLATSENSDKLATTSWVKSLGFTAGISGITTQKTSVNIGTPSGVNTINFTGAGVTLSTPGPASIVEVNIPEIPVIPVGTIVLWYGSRATIPTGWIACEGQTVLSPTTLGLVTAPDLRGLFVAGAGGVYNPGDTGGTGSYSTSAAGGHNHGGNTADHILTTNEIPSHTHGINYKLGGKADGGSAFDTNDVAQTGNVVQTASAGGNLGHNHVINAQADHTHTVSNVLPPFRALFYIMKV